MISHCRKAGHPYLDDDGNLIEDNVRINAAGKPICKACRRTGNPPGPVPATTCVYGHGNLDVDRSGRRYCKRCKKNGQAARRRREDIQAYYMVRVERLSNPEHWLPPTRYELELDLPGQARLYGTPMPSADEIEAYVQRELVRDMRAAEVIALNTERERYAAGNDPVLADWAADLEPVD